VGIPEAEHANVFGRFHRGRNVASYPGSGLGLAIVRATVESFGATEREAFRTGLATMLGVAASEVTITVSAGSVLVTAVVTASSADMQQTLSTHRQMLLKGASAMLLCHAVLMAAAVIVYLDRDKEDPLHEEWDYGTCYYFCFVTFSSIFSSSGWACLSNVPSGAKGSPALLYDMRRVGTARGNCLLRVHGYPMAIDLARLRMLLHQAKKR
jgi:hypothetical protein